MRRGCLPLIGLAIVALGVEWWLARAFGVPYAGVVAAVLALSTTLAVGSLLGIAGARRSLAAPDDDPAAWRDGATVRTGGVLQAAGEPPRAPFSLRPAVYLEYRAWTPDAAADVQVAQRPHWRGLVGAPAMLQTAAGPIALWGMPPPRHWPQEQFADEVVHARAAAHLATTTWQRAPEVTSLDRADALAGFAGQPQDGGTQVHLMNAEAEHALGLPVGGAIEPEQLRLRLAQRPWNFAERVVAPGTRVTVVGTYRALPRRLEVGLSPLTPDHAVLLGAAAPLAARNLQTTLLFALGLFALAAAAHWFVYGGGGAHLRGLLAALGAAA